MDISVLAGNLVMSIELVVRFHLGVRGFRGGIGRLVVLLSICQLQLMVMMGEGTDAV